MKKMTRVNAQAFNGRTVLRKIVYNSSNCDFAPDRVPTLKHQKGFIVHSSFCLKNSFICIDLLLRHNTNEDFSVRPFPASFSLMYFSIHIACN